MVVHGEGGKMGQCRNKENARGMGRSSRNRVEHMRMGWRSWVLEKKQCGD